jgi:hypothetical protein
VYFLFDLQIIESFVIRDHNPQVQLQEPVQRSFRSGRELVGAFWH